ncbi:MAG: 6-phosphofructokinase [Candidatus Omnitrophica bacterium]|nr:6-phosphofructokinase [Candidatus Omnitrophota bacterium]
MAKKQSIKKIGVLCSGGDGPGMNAGLRAVVRAGIFHGLEVEGIMRGYQGLIDNELIDMGPRSVSNIINRGGTIIKTARSAEFRTEKGMQKAVKTLQKHKIDALVVVGGDGSYLGASALFSKFGVATVGIPGTIDNDLHGTDQTIGCHTALNTALEAIDKVRDTAHSMERIFVIEVMGNRSGYIATEVALSAGAEDVIVPELKPNYQEMCDSLRKGHKKGKISWMIVTAEGGAKAQTVADTITNMTGLETRAVVLGHVMRGGTPCAHDRLLATRLGVAAVEELLKGNAGKAIGVIRDKINIIPLADAKKRDNDIYAERYRLIKMLR